MLSPGPPLRMITLPLPAAPPPLSWPQATCSLPALTIFLFLRGLGHQIGEALQRQARAAITMETPGPGPAHVADRQHRRLSGFRSVAAPRTGKLGSGPGRRGLAQQGARQERGGGMGGPGESPQLAVARGDVTRRRCEARGCKCPWCPEGTGGWLQLFPPRPWPGLAPHLGAPICSF